MRTIVMIALPLLTLAAVASPGQVEPLYEDTQIITSKRHDSPVPPPGVAGRWIWSDTTGGIAEMERMVLYLSQSGTAFSGSGLHRLNGSPHLGPRLETLALKVENGVIEGQTSTKVAFTIVEADLCNGGIASCLRFYGFVGDLNANGTRMDGSLFRPPHGTATSAYYPPPVQVSFVKL